MRGILLLALCLGTIGTSRAQFVGPGSRARPRAITPIGGEKGQRIYDGLDIGPPTYTFLTGQLGGPFLTTGGTYSIGGVATTAIGWEFGGAKNASSTWTVTSALTAGGGFIFYLHPIITNTPGTALSDMGTWRFLLHSPRFRCDGNGGATACTLTSSEVMNTGRIFEGTNSGTLTATSDAVIVDQPNYNAGSVITTRRGYFFRTRAGTVNPTTEVAFDVESLTGATPISLRSAGANQLRHAGPVRIGDTTAAGAGSEISLAPVAAPGSPVLGDEWLDTTQQCLETFYGSSTANGIKEYDTRNLFSLTTNGTVTTTASTTTAVDILTGSAGIGTRTLPASFFVPGKSIRITARGTSTCGASGPTKVFAVRFGSTVMASNTALAAATVTDLPWILDVVITNRTTGASGTFMALGQVQYYTSTSAFSSAPMCGTGASCTATTATVNTAASQVVNLFVTPSSTTGTCTFNTTVMTVEVIS